MDSAELYKQVLQICGLSSVVGPGLLHRSLKDVGANPRTAIVPDYRKALPRIRMRMEVFVTAEEAARRVSLIEEFLHKHSKPPPAHTHSYTPPNEEWDEIEEEHTGRIQFSRSIEILRELENTERMRRRSVPVPGLIEPGKPASGSSGKDDTEKTSS